MVKEYAKYVVRCDVCHKIHEIRDYADAADVGDIILTHCNCNQSINTHEVIKKEVR